MLVLIIGFLIAAVGCTKAVDGTAQPDPEKPPLTLSKDGYGIVAGYTDAPVRIEVYTEPQCAHCADLQGDFGDEMARYINLGQLAVTYRPLTFLDSTDGGHSMRVANAMFLAVGPVATERPVQASGPEFQRFVQELWANQNPGGEGPSDAEMEDLALKAGMPGDVARKIGSGRGATNTDVAEAVATNFVFLIDVDPLDSGTPTVYDLENSEKLDIYDNAWLSKLMSSV